MIELIMASMVLALFQSLLPTLINAKNLNYFVSNRDKDIDLPPVVARVKNAARNLLESLPIFLTLATLAIINDIDIAQEATAWLVFRLAYLVCYAAGIAYLRTLIWFGSVFSLIAMAVQLV